MIPLIRRKDLDILTIQSYVGLSSFQKGESYAINKAIRQGKWKHHVLTALCQGKEFDPYHVEAIVDENGIQHSYCSCPVGASGKCKHVAALLLTWLYEPDSFIAWDNLLTPLEHYDTSTLLELIDLLDDKLTDSSSLIRAFQKSLKTAKSPRLAKYFQRIEEAFNVSALPWYHPTEGGITEIAFALNKIRLDADQLLPTQQFTDILRVHQSLIQHILNYLDEHPDPWENLSEEIKGSVRSLDQLLAHLPFPDEKRQKILHLLFRLIEEQLYRDINIGAEEAKQVILQHVQPAERDQVVWWIQALQVNQQSETAQRSLEDFSIDLRKDQLDPDVYLLHYRETRQILKLVDSLLALGRIKEAKQAAQSKEFTSQTLAIAQLFVKHQQPDIAEKLVLQFAKQRPDLAAFRWLKEFYQQQGQLEQALEQAKHMLYLAPQFNYYQDVQELAKNLKQWPALRQEILLYFQDLQNYLLLVEIYLDEKELKSAIEALEQATLAMQGLTKDTYYTLLALRLADAARHKYPEFALRIYQEMVQNLIEERSRESYRRACDHLKTIRSIYQDLQQADQWDNYLKMLMQTYHRLKALRDEVYQARLIE